MSIKEILLDKSKQRVFSLRLLTKQKSLLNSQGVIFVKNLVEQLKLAKTGAEEAMLEILDRCSPLIKKYTRLLNYDEDNRSELILKLITLVKKEIDIDKLQNPSDGAIIKYISIALSHHYIALSTTNCQIRDNETTYEQDTTTDLLENIPQNSNEIEDSIILEALKSVLTEKEQKCIQLIILKGWTAEAVATELGVSKQAINQCKNRALKKLKSFYS